MEDRRYRQPGYRGKSPGGDRREPPPPPSRPSQTLTNRSVSRCAGCGGVLPITAESLTQCPRCRAELRACRNCAHFETERRFECVQPIPERIADKNAVNECAYFSLRVTVERDTSAGAVRPDDARGGFGNLFKK